MYSISLIQIIYLQIIDHVYLGKSYQDIFNIYKIIDKINVVPGNKKIRPSFLLYIAKQGLYSISEVWRRVGKKCLGSFTQKWNELLTLVSFQTRETSVHLRNTNYDIFDWIWKIPEPP